jgi:hypothetical protein
MLEDENDVIIAYSKCEHLIQEYKNAYIPQWISTDLISSTRGIHSPFNNIIICQTHDEMKRLGLHKISKEINFKPRNVYFYYVVGQFSLCNNKPFLNNTITIFDKKLYKSCNTCGRYQEHKMKKCSKCNLRYYCDEKCQRKDWNKHKLRCK